MGNKSEIKLRSGWTTDGNQKILFLFPFFLCSSFFVVVISRIFSRPSFKSAQNTNCEINMRQTKSLRYVAIDTQFYMFEPPFAPVFAFEMSRSRQLNKNLVLIFSRSPFIAFTIEID